MPCKKRKKRKTRGGSSACGYATRSTAKEIEEKSSVCFTTKSAGALWERHP